MENLIINNSNKKQYRNITEVKGFLKIEEGVNFYAPYLISCICNVYIVDNSIFNAPKLKNIEGDINIAQRSKLKAKILEKVEGSIFLDSNSKLKARKLKSYCLYKNF